MSDIVRERHSEPYRDRHRQTDGIEPTATHMQIERQMQVYLEADIHGSDMYIQRDTERETYIQAYMQTGMQAVRAMHAETDIDTDIHGRHLQSVRQADTGRHSQPDS